MGFHRVPWAKNIPVRGGGLSLTWWYWIQGPRHVCRRSPAHMPREVEGVAGSRWWSGDIITVVGCCRGCKGQRQRQVVETLTPHVLREGEEGWTVCQPPCTLNLWRPWWFKVNNVREGCACTRPRTVKVSSPYRVTQSFKQNHPFFRYRSICYLSWTLPRSLPRRDSSRGDIAGTLLSIKGRALSVDWRWTDSYTDENPGDCYDALMVIFVNCGPKVARAIIRTTTPVQGILPTDAANQYTACTFFVQRTLSE